MARELNRDMGLIMRRHPTGSLVQMIHSEPGLYYDAKGNDVSTEFAEEAGFDIENHRIERMRNKALGEAQAKIDAIAQAERDKVEERVQKEAASKPKRGGRKAEEPEEGDGS